MVLGLTPCASTGDHHTKIAGPGRLQGILLCKRWQLPLISLPGHTHHYWQYPVCLSRWGQGTSTASPPTMIGSLKSLVQENPHFFMDREEASKSSLLLSAGRVRQTHAEGEGWGRQAAFRLQQEFPVQTSQNSAAAAAKGGWLWGMGTAQSNTVFIFPSRSCSWPVSL